MVVLTVKNLTLPFGSPNEIRFLTLFSFREIGQWAVATSYSGMLVDVIQQYLETHRFLTLYWCPYL